MTQLCIFLITSKRNAVRIAHDGWIDEKRRAEHLGNVAGRGKLGRSVFSHVEIGPCLNPS